MDLPSPIHHLDICSGTGMLGVALKLVFAEQLRTVCYVERESYAASSLVARMEDSALDQAPIWDDVCTFKGRPWRGLVEIISAGYPCQPFSSAGKRAGTRDPRHIWPDIARIVGEAQPLIVFLENVEGHLSLGFENVCQDLQAMGYRHKVGLYAAAEVGATHRRRRMFIFAYSNQLREALKLRRAIASHWIGLAAAGGLNVADAGRVRLGGGQPGQSLSGAGMDRTQRLADSDCGKHTPQTNVRKQGATTRTRSSIVADADDPGSRAGERREQTQTRSVHRGGSANKSGDVAHAQCGGRKGSPLLWRGKSNAGMVRTAMADAGEPGLSHTQQQAVAATPLSQDAQQGAAAPELCGTPIQLFPPCPGELEAWRRVIAIDPTLEPALCRMAHGMAGRVDRLRLCGNGVVPLGAAYAFVSLFARALVDEVGPRMDRLMSNIKTKRVRGVHAYLARSSAA